MSQIKIKRGTRAQLDAAASGAELIQGEPYLITDEDRIAVGLSTTTYEEFVKPADPISDLAETVSAKILTNSERNKLDGIETNATADQSAAEIKTAYESNADTNEFSDAEQTLLGNQSGTNTGDEPAASSTVPGIVELATIAEVDTGTDATRAITPDALEGSALQAKVDGIETNATADQSAAEIKTAYESNADTNEFSDAEQTLLGNQSGTNTGDEPAASVTVPGIVELATIGEVDTGTDTTRAITPDALEGSALQTKVDGIEAGATTDLFAATNSNAAAITIGQPVYVDGSGTVDLARANAAATDRAIGLVADASIAAAASGNIQQGGIVTSTDWTSVIGSTTLTAGADYFLSAATAGRLTATAPTTAGQFVVYVGHAISTTKMLIEIDRPVGL